MTQRREDKFKEIDAEGQALSGILSDEESSESKTKRKSQESSSCSVGIKQMSLESNDKEDIDYQQDISDSQNDFTSNTGKSMIDMHQICKSKTKGKKSKKKIEQIMRHSAQGHKVKLGEFITKYDLSAPYHLFFTRVEKSEETYNQPFSITFPEILDKSLGEIVNTLHLNHRVNVDWLWAQYQLADQHADILILCDKIYSKKLRSNITIVHVDMPEFGCHHSKIMILQYKDGGIRVVVSTANLYSTDWKTRTQGLWISPHLPPLPPSKSTDFNHGESPTDFKKDLKRYLSKYDQPALTEWISIVRRTDFSAVNVFLVASVPGRNTANEINFWGYRKLAYVLSRHATLPPDAPKWPIVAQSSSVGTFGQNFESDSFKDRSWLAKKIIPCMSKDTTKGAKKCPNFQFIYPSIENYKQSYDCQGLSRCLEYSTERHSKQKWLEPYLYQWKAVRTGRDNAMPYIKSYTRISPDLKYIPWFMLTSSNLSKAGLGVQRGNCHITYNYEVGVIFIPKLITNTMTFPIENEEDPIVPVFPIPYDLPLTRYESSDKPFINEFIKTA